MALIPQEIIDKAKNADLLLYLQHKGYNLISDTKNQNGKAYRLAEHDSLVISNNMWYWFSQQYGGNTLDFLIKYEGKEFRAAVEELTGQSFNKTESKQEKKNENDERSYYKFFYSGVGGQDKEAEEFQKSTGWNMIWGSDSHGLNGDTWVVYRSILDLPKYLQGYAKKQEEIEKNVALLKKFKLPEKAENFRRVFAYLTKSRGVDPNTISYLMHKKLIYESKDNHNCVFIGFDKQGTARYANLRGTLTDKTFKMDCLGSNKKYSFSIPGTNNTLRVFEGAIDAISDISLSKYLHPNVDPYDVHRLSLGGVEALALHQYLSDYPEIKSIILRLDNDPTGRGSAKKIMAELIGSGYNVVIKHPKEKDVNADLIFFSRKHNLSNFEADSSVYNKINQAQNIIKASQSSRGKNNDREGKSEKNVKCDR